MNETIVRNRVTMALRVDPTLVALNETWAVETDGDGNTVRMAHIPEHVSMLKFSSGIAVTIVPLRWLEEHLDTNGEPPIDEYKTLDWGATWHDLYPNRIPLTWKHVMADVFGWVVQILSLEPEQADHDDCYTLHPLVRKVEPLGKGDAGFAVTIKDGRKFKFLVTEESEESGG